MRYILILLALVLIGCTAPQEVGLDELPEGDRVPVYKWRTKWLTKIEKVYETNWLATVFVCGVAGSIFMIIQGVKVGWGVLAASAGGLIFMRLDQTLAEQTWPYLIMGAILLIGFGWYAYNTFIRKRAFNEVVAGGEWFKKAYPTGIIDFKAMQAESQSKSTEKLVDKEREKL